MKTVAYIALHYGVDYLRYAIQSIIDDVQEVHVLYADNPSHGHGLTHVSRPEHETRRGLYLEAVKGAKNKLVWHEGLWVHEGEHRDYIYQVTNADCIVVLDSDEIWGKGFLRHALDSTQAIDNRFWRVPIIHYWRSFRRCVLHDPAYPVRLIYPHRLLRYDAVGQSSQNHWINHMGYAQNSATVRYKMTIHGHKNELRPNWYEAVFVPNVQTNCHPVGSEYWNPDRVNPLDYMPDFMREHPYFDMEVIP